MLWGPRRGHFFVTMFLKVNVQNVFDFRRKLQFFGPEKCIPKTYMYFHRLYQSFIQLRILAVDTSFSP